MMETQLKLYAVNVKITLESLNPSKMFIVLTVVL